MTPTSSSTRASSSTPASSSSRASRTTRVSRRIRKGRKPRSPLTLSRRLLLTVIAVLAVVSTIIGVVAVAVLYTSLIERVDAQLQRTTDRGSVAIGFPLQPGERPDAQLPSAGQILGARSQAEGTAALVAKEGERPTAGYLNAGGEIAPMTIAQGDKLLSVEADGEPHTVDLGGDLGLYRAVAFEVLDGTIVIALPLASVNATVVQLAITIALVALIGILLVAVLGSWIVRIALRPL